MRSLCLPCSRQFDQVGDKQVGRDQEIEKQAGDNVGSSIVVAADADEDAVLLKVHDHQSKVRYDYQSQQLSRA